MTKRSSNGKSVTSFYLANTYNIIAGQCSPRLESKITVKKILFKVFIS